MKYQEKKLDVPLLAQANSAGKGGDWCGRASASMVYNYFQKAAGKGEDSYITNETELVYPNGDKAALNASGNYILCEPLNRSFKGWKRKTLFPVSGRPSGTASAQKQLEVLSPVLNSLDRNTPLVIYSGISTNKSTPRHLVVICGYRQRDDGLWLLIADPATIDVGTQGKIKAEQLGAVNLEILEKGQWQAKGCRYWLRASRLFEENARSTRSGDLWCDHCDRPGFVVWIHETHVEAESGQTSHIETNAGLHFPIEGDTVVDDASVEAYHRHVEVEHGGGYYPLGTNTVWHGGVHLHLEKGKKVHASLAGTVVAARLAGTEDEAYGHYGSHNFVLVRHHHGEKPFFALTMHLAAEALEASNPALEGISWLLTSRPASAEAKPFVRVEKQVSFRTEPRSADETYAGSFASQATAPWLATEGGWHKIDVDGQERWITASSTYTTKVDLADTQTEQVLDEELLAELAGGGVVKIDRPIPMGGVVWTAGEYGSEGYRTGLLHWEVFSEELLFPGWEQVVDEDDDFNVDNEKIVALVPQSDDWFEDDEVLTAEELRAFYKDNPDAKNLRSYACKFISEWGVDLDKAIETLKKAWYRTVGLEEKMAPYLWWDDVAAAGVELPADRHVWHYNPIALLDSLRGDATPCSTAPSPAEEDRSEPEDAPAEETTDTVQCGQELQEELEDAHPDYHTGFEGYGSGADQYVCTTYCVEVLDRAGYDLSADTREQINIANISELSAAANPNQKLKELVLADDPRTKGVVKALVDTEQGEEVAITSVQPGDFIQYWTVYSSGTVGGHSGQVFEHHGDGEIDLHSAHSSKDRICLLEGVKLGEKAKAYAVRPKGSTGEPPPAEESGDAPYGGHVLKKGDLDSAKRWGGEVLAQGDCFVAELQKDLCGLGYWISHPSADHGTRADGDFGVSVRGAVILFQREHGLPETGEVDEATAKEIKAAVDGGCARAGHCPSNCAGATFYQLPPSENYGRYGTYPFDGDRILLDVWGTRAMIDALTKAGEAWAAKGYGPFLVGDISLQDGGKFKPHASHKEGTAADIAGGSWCDIRKDYFNKEESLELAKTLAASGVKRVLFNCKYVIDGCTEAKALSHHYHHFHVDVVTTPTAAHPDQECLYCALYDSCDYTAKVSH